MTYKQINDITLSLHVFLPENAPASPRPMIVFFHGGGWKSGTADQFFPQASHLADRGMIAISADYRVSSRHETTPFDAIRDAFEAIRYARRNANRWHGDPNRLAAGGGSAGGHLAACLATLTAEDLAGSEEQREAARPDALVLFNPVYDNGPTDGYGNDRLGERWRDASPAHNLHADMPPTLVMLGDQDQLIPISTAEHIKSQLHALGVPNRLIIYEGAQHAFFNPSVEDGKFYRETVADMDDFLTELGWITAPHTGD